MDFKGFLKHTKMATIRRVPTRTARRAQGFGVWSLGFRIFYVTKDCLGVFRGVLRLGMVVSGFEVPHCSGACKQIPISQRHVWGTKKFRAFSARDSWEQSPLMVALHSKYSPHTTQLNSATSLRRTRNYMYMYYSSSAAFSSTSSSSSSYYYYYY